MVHKHKNMGGPLSLRRQIFGTEILRRKAIQALSLVLSISLAAAPTFANQTIPQHEPVFQGQSFEGLDRFPRPEKSDEKEWSEYLLGELQNADKTNLEKVTATGTDIVQLMVRYRDFYAKSRVEIDKVIDEIGQERFVTSRLDRDLVKFTDPELGTMEFTNIDGEPVAKIVHDESKVGFIIYDEKRTDRNSNHFKTYIARQHYDAGKNRQITHYRNANGRKKKIKPGRDILLMGIDNKDVSRVEANSRKRGIKQWWHATYKQPQWRNNIMNNDYIQGVFSGIAQFGGVLGLAHLVDFFLPMYDAGSTPMAMAAFTLAFGTMLGTWNSFYQNWRSRGGKRTRDFKNMLVSYSYYFGIAIIGAAGSQHVTLHDFSIDPSTVVAYIQTLMDSIPSPGQAVETVRNTHPLAALAASHFFLNFAINNELKNVGYWMQRIQEEERRDLGQIDLSLPAIDFNEGKGVDVKLVKVPLMTKRFWNRQYKYYLPVNFSKFLDQAWFGATIIPAMAGEVPAWYPLLSVFGFFGMTYASVKGINKWAYSKYPQTAKKLKIREESNYYFADYYIQAVKKTPGAIARGVRRSGQAIANTAKRCVDFLKP